MQDHSRKLEKLQRRRGLQRNKNSLHKYKIERVEAHHLFNAIHTWSTTAIVLSVLRIVIVNKMPCDAFTLLSAATDRARR
uniref:Uncharacterized protein n=1 Tax=Glossina palpalis gambiensis TaxID=67801 RepID=A0A1B0BMD7_9MUSC